MSTTILATGGLNDPRVSYWEPAKWVQKLRAATTSGKPRDFVMQPPQSLDRITFNTPDDGVLAGYVPSGMIFVRNRNGSHNPDEAMSLADFQKAADVLSNFLVGRAS